MGGAIRARVELKTGRNDLRPWEGPGAHLETEPTREMNRSSLGTAAAREKVRRTRLILRMYSAFRWLSGWTLSINNDDDDNSPSNISTVFTFSSVWDSED